MTAIESAVASHTYTIYIDATAEEVWSAITDGEQTVRYGYGCPVAYDLRPGGVFLRDRQWGDERAHVRRDHRG